MIFKSPHPPFAKGGEGGFSCFESAPSEYTSIISISLDEAKINLSALEVGRIHPHLHPIPETERHSAAFAYEHVLPLQELVAVLRQPGQVDQPFDEKTLQLHEDSKREDSRDIPVEFLAHFVSHELHFFAFHDLPFGLHG